ncbi:SusC/RagA family TonB-linked outer membrane protein [Flavivirga sp. 57AJ16]|uniref:SusC/RagA family TonB-linked outer membrane protein n=1 Tax=Flavivirga sp. 57AJ16 TaxID=3025307 RepID=UPI0023671110|nr:SusC/RagA family TonB-linked outer membrane protein [Flavivirga sp. 57AJ16]MDD7886793.1 SusC/RagA family TonB-linked outer membrane protein [Flavivirga sp. 57AJ16]
MRTFILLFCTTVFSLSSGNILSQNTKVTIDADKTVMVDEVFKIIIQQTDYTIIYQAGLFKDFPKVELKKGVIRMDKLINQSIKGGNLNVVLTEDNTILIKEAKTQQQIQVSGKVTDDKEMPLSGVTVLIKGTTKGTATNFDGSYNITVPNPENVLVFSVLGFKTQEISIREQRNINITMEEEISNLDEVVISTGYQKIKPEQSTGSVTVIKSKEFESQVNNDFLSGLANRIPGLMINDNVGFTSNVDGEISSRSLFNIRGISTISGNQNPLIVIDGFPTELTLDMINPNEIESVTVLKDAAAATVYGVRASNGVIVIERKKAAVGKPKVQYRVNFGFTPKENYSRYNYASNASELAVNYIRDLNTSVDPLAYSGFFNYTGRYAENPVYYLLAMQSGNIIPPSRIEEALIDLGKYDNVEDYERLFLRAAESQNHNLNVSGGSTNYLYYLTLNHVRNSLSQINNNDERTMLSIRTNLKLSKRLSLELTNMYMESDAYSAPIPNVDTAYRFEPYADEDGNALPINNGSIINPYYNTYIMSLGLQDHLYYPLTDALHVKDHQHTVNNRFNANFKYGIGKGLDLAFGGIYENSRTDFVHYADEESTEVRQTINNFITINPEGSLNYNIPVGAYLNETTSTTNTYTLRSQLNYNKNIGENHSVNAILGGEIRGILTEGSNRAYYGYNEQNLLQQPVDYSELGNNFVSTLFGSQSLSYPFSKTYQEDRFMSVYSNIVYSFRNTYSLTGSFRIDQSNLFGTNPKYRYKPLWSVGVAWNVHNENFMEDISWLNNLKFRMAYGFNGNVTKNSLPEVIASSYLNTDTSPASTALELFSLANSTLRWEQTSNFNIGLDFGFSKNINGSVDFYTKRSTDVLNNAQIDPTYGKTTSLLNEASINNKGFEFNLQADWISLPTFNWNTGLVFSRNTSKVLNVYEYSSDNLPNELNVRGYVPGYPIGALFVYRDGGLDDSGYPVVLDEEGISQPTTSLSLSTEGLTYYAGSSIPTISAGLSNRIDIGNFYLFCLMSYYGGFKVQVPRIRPGDPVAGSDNYWKQPGDEETTDIVGIEANNYYLTHHIYDNLDTFVVNGDYITLKTITASYNFDDKKLLFLKKAGINSFELKLQASNLFTVGLNKYNYSLATGNYYKQFLTPTFTTSLLINF